MPVTSFEVDMRDIVRLVISIHQGMKFGELVVGTDGRIYEVVDEVHHSG